MCGLAGIALAEPSPDAVDSVARMTGRLAHRGPDDHGIWSSDGIVLGHRRLAIVDLGPTSRQPMVDTKTGSALVFNGEIYNHKALRARLESAGERFGSTGDTEVLLRALVVGGEAALERVDGMFAFAFWDASSRRLLLARDRFGEKPLYYALFGPDGRRGIAFASELRALMTCPAVREEATLDPTAMVQFLVHEFVPAPRTILAGVRKLCAGELLDWRHGRGARARRYYEAPVNDVGRTRGDEGELVERLRDAMIRSTALRLEADVPVGVLLSGGLDSTFVTACAVRATSRVQTFSVGFEDATYDETSHARTVAQAFGTEHHEERLSSQRMLELVPSLLADMDEPLADSSLLPTQLVASIARRHVKVVLSGDGGDEILAGYPSFVAGRLTSWMPPLPRLVAAALQRAAAVLPVDGGNLSTPFLARQFAAGLAARGGARDAAWLAPVPPGSLARVVGPAIPPSALAGALDAVHAATAGVRDDFARRTAFYLRLYLAEGVLTKLDRATMRVSLESRAPLLAREVVELCLGLPEKHRLRGRTTKRLMRLALRDWAPPAIIRRPKKGFGAPVGEWLRGPLLELARATLSPARIRDAGWLSPEVVAATLDAHAAGTGDHRKTLYAFLVLHAWRDHALGSAVP